MSSIPQDVIEATYGAMVVGMMVQQLLLGVVCIQVFNYYRTFPADPMFYKCLVGLLAVLNIFMGATNFHSIYRVSVTHYGDFDAFDLPTWTLWAEPVITATIGFVAHVFFLERCYRTTKSWPLLAFLILLVLTSFGSGISATVGFASFQRLSLVGLNLLQTTVWLVSTAVTDLAIAAVLVASLVQSKTPFKATERVIFRMSRLSMETSSTTALAALATLILYYAYPNTIYDIIPQLCQSRLYTSAVMVTLSSRTEMREILFGQDHASFATRAAAPDDNWKIQNIKVTTTTTQESVHERGRSWENPYDVELGVTKSTVQHGSDVSLGDSKPEALCQP